MSNKPASVETQHLIGYGLTGTGKKTSTADELEDLRSSEPENSPTEGRFARKKQSPSKKAMMNLVDVVAKLVAEVTKLIIL